MINNQILIKRIVKNAIVVVLYVALTFASYPIAFSGLQFRISEILVLLCFFNRDYIFAISIGCFLCNLASPMMPWDLLIGTSATILSCLAISFSKYLAISILFPIIFNSFLIGVEYWWLLFDTNINYFYCVGIIAVGESVVMVVGYLLYLFIMKKEFLYNMIDGKQNKDFKW